MDVGDHAQSMLLRDWHSATAAIFLVLLLLVLLLYVLEIRAHRADLKAAAANERAMAKAFAEAMTAYRNSNLKLVATIRQLMPRRLGEQLTEAQLESEVHSIESPK